VEMLLRGQNHYNMSRCSLLNSRYEEFLVFELDILNISVKRVSSLKDKNRGLRVWFL